MPMGISAANEVDGPPLGPVARKIRRIRARLGLSQNELGQAIGVSGMTVSRWETGKAAPEKQCHRVALAKTLGGQPGHYLQA
jgi:transcriptional regulator with XRE-family HTH domain